MEAAHDSFDRHIEDALGDRQHALDPRMAATGPSQNIIRAPPHCNRTRQHSHISGPGECRS
jgi:hypothetical protein